MLHTNNKQMFEEAEACAAVLQLQRFSLQEGDPSNANSMNSGFLWVNELPSGCVEVTSSLLYGYGPPLTQNSLLSFSLTILGGSGKVVRSLALEYSEPVFLPWSIQSQSQASTVIGTDLPTSTVNYPVWET